VIDALLAIPLILLAVTVVAAPRQPLDVDGDHRHRSGLHSIIARTVRAAGSGRPISTTSRRHDFGRARSVRDVLGGASERHAADPRRGDDPPRYADLRGRDAQLHRVRLQPPSPDSGRADRRQLRRLAFEWWSVLFLALAIASLVVAVNLVSIGLQQVLER
jgi:hypothetical protein